MMIDYKKSIFTVEEKIEEDKILVYNMLTQSYFVYDNNLLDQNWNEIRDSNFREKMIQGKFLVATEIDESADLLKKFKKINDYNEELNLVLVLTTGCNMRCVYCYEEELEISKLSNQTLNQMIKWINKQIQAYTIKKVNILLFGGEPLLNPCDTIRILKILKKDINAIVEFSMATNGINLEKNILREMFKLGLTGIQVPIDGPKKIHEMRRPLKNKKGENYTRIIHNLKEVSQLPISITIKINIDKQNITCIEELLDDLISYHLQKDIILKFEAIALTQKSVEDTGHYCNKFAYDSRAEEIAKAYDICMRVADDKGFCVSETVGNITPCMFTSKNEFVLNSDGNIYKCISAIGMEEFLVGNVETGVTDKYVECLSRIDLADKCLEKKCPYVPKCGGGCAYEKVLKDGILMEVDCKYNYYKEYYKRKFIRKMHGK